MSKELFRITIRGNSWEVARRTYSNDYEFVTYGISESPEDAELDAKDWCDTTLAEEEKARKETRVLKYNGPNSYISPR